ncbi:MAG: hypothetical protein V5A44_04020 [Haloarculaceae archaeon]
MQSASPTPAGIDQQTACDATSVDFTGEFKWDWKPKANAGTDSFGPTNGSLVRRYRSSGHPPATGYGHP